MIRIQTLAAACLSLMAVSLAQAASTSSASVKQLKFLLIDLTPDDGVAPSFQLLGEQNLSSVNGWVDDAFRSSPGIALTSQSVPGWMAPLVGETSTVAGLAGSSWSIQAQSMSVSGSANGAGAKYEWNLTSGTTAPGDYWLRNVELAANSALLVRLDYALDALASNAPACPAGDICTDLVGVNTEMSRASVGLSLSYNYEVEEDGLFVSYNKGVGNSISATATRGVEAGAYFLDRTAGVLVKAPVAIAARDQAQHADGTLELVFANASPSTQLANLRVSVGIWGQASTPAVPEAGTAGAFALGLTGLMLVRRRLGARPAR
jgi:hypothetical protein